MTKSKKKDKKSKKRALLPRRNAKAKAIQEADYLSLLNRTKNKNLRKKLIDIANRDQIDAVAEIVENVLRGTLVLSQVQKKKLHKYKTCMRQLSARTLPLAKKRKYMQTGGFIPALLGLALPTLTNLVTSLIK